MNITAQDVTLFVSEKNEIDILLSALFKRARARPGFTPPGPEHAPETFILLLPGARGESTTRIVSRYCYGFSTARAVSHMQHQYHNSSETK